MCADCRIVWPRNTDTALPREACVASLDRVKLFFRENSLVRFIATQKHVIPSLPLKNMSSLHCHLFTFCVPFNAILSIP